MNRRHFLVQGSQFALGGAVLSQLPPLVSELPLVPPAELRGGLGFVARGNELIRQNYEAFFSESPLEGMKVRSRAGTYKHSFGFYFHHRVVEFGVTAGALMHGTSGFMLFNGLPSLDGSRGSCFASDASSGDIQLWERVYHSLNVHPLVFADTGGGVGYLRRRGSQVAPDARIACEPDQRERLEAMGFNVVPASSLRTAVRAVAEGRVDLTDSFPLAVMDHAFESLSMAERKSLELVTDSQLLPEAHFEMLVRKDVWDVMSARSRREFSLATNRSRDEVAKAAEQVRSVLLKEISARIEVQKESSETLMRFAERVLEARAVARRRLEEDFLAGGLRELT